MTDAPRPTARPNYAARRMLVSTIGITAVVAVALLGWRAASGGDGVGPAGSPGEPGEWDEIALVDRSTGAVVTVDGDGDVAHEIDGAGRVVAVHAAGDRLALVGSDQIVLVGADGGDRVVVPVDRGAVVTRLATSGGLRLAVGAPAGGDVLLVSGDGMVVDVGELAGQAAPRMFVETIRHDAAGERVAVADAANFQTILVRDGADEPVYVADVPIAVGPTTVATSQVVGDSADVGIYDDEHGRLAGVQVDIPVGAVVDGDRLVVVSAAGALSGVRPGDAVADGLGSVSVPSGDAIRSVDVTADGERLVLAGDLFVAVVDLDGTTVFTTTLADAPAGTSTGTPGDASTDASGGTSSSGRSTGAIASAVAGAADPPQTGWGWACLPIGVGGRYDSLIDLRSGEPLADLGGLAVTGAASDGCTVLGIAGDGVVWVVSPVGGVSLGRVRAAVLGPDGRTVVVRDRDGATGVVHLDVDDGVLAVGGRVDVSAVAPAALAVAFLDR